MTSSATPLHDSLIELANPDAHAHAIKWYLKAAVVPTSTMRYMLINVCRSVLVAMEWLKDSMLLKITTTVGILLLYYPTAQSQAEIGEHSINFISPLSLIIERPS